VPAAFGARFFSCHLDESSHVNACTNVSRITWAAAAATARSTAANRFGPIRAAGKWREPCGVAPRHSNVALFAPTPPAGVERRFVTDPFCAGLPRPHPACRGGAKVRDKEQPAHEPWLRAGKRGGGRAKWRTIASGDEPWLHPGKRGGGQAEIVPNRVGTQLIVLETIGKDPRPQCPLSSLMRTTRRLPPFSRKNWRRP
jgi:hypothetical protein